MIQQCFRVLSSGQACAGCWKPVLKPRDVKASRPMWPPGQFIRPQPRPHSFWPPPRSRPHRNWPRIFTVHMTLINIHNIAIDNHFFCVLVTENYVLNANILVFMLIHTELFSNVSALGLIHCGLHLEKIFGPRPHSFWHRPWPHAQLASLTSLLKPQT